jgi:hypothetical protein
MIVIVSGVIAILVLFALTELFGRKGNYKSSGKEDED